MIDLNELANQTAFGQLVGASQQSISQHVKNGVLSDSSTHAEWLKEYCEHLRGIAAGRPENSDDIKAVTIREKTANAVHKETVTKQLLGTLVDEEEFYQKMVPLFNHMRNQLDPVGSRVATALSAQLGVTVDKRLIDTEIRSALSEIGKYVGSSEGN